MAIQTGTSSGEAELVSDAPEMDGNESDQLLEDFTSAEDFAAFLPMMSRGEFAQTMGDMRLGGDAARPFAPVQADGVRGKIVNEAMKYLGIDYVWGGTSPSGFDCVAEGTLVSTVDRGPVPIEDIRPGEMVCGVSGGRVKPAPVVALVDKGVQPAFQVRLRNRKLVASAGHVVKVLMKNPGWHSGFSMGWKRVDALSRGDLVITARAAPGSGVDYTPGEAWLLGAYLGDGHVSNGKSIYWCLFGEDRERAARILEAMGLPCHRSDGHGLRVGVGGFALARIILDQIGTGSASKRVPEWVWSADRKVRESFLDGYLAADGSVDKRGWLTFHSISRPMLEQVRHLAIGLDMNVSNIRKQERTKPIVIKGKSVRDAKPIYSFQTYRGVNKIPETVRLNGGGRSFDDDSLSASAVLAVAPVEPVRMFDIEVAGEESFLADGVAVHNCSGLIQYVFGKFGYDLPRISYAQARYGKQIDAMAAQPGDLIAWDNSSRNNGADHIAIALGGGKILEAPRTGLQVRIRDLDPDEGAWGVDMSGRL